MVTGRSLQGAVATTQRGARTQSTPDDGSLLYHPRSEANGWDDGVIPMDAADQNPPFFGRDTNADDVAWKEFAEREQRFLRRRGKIETARRSLRHHIVENVIGGERADDLRPARDDVNRTDFSGTHDDASAVDPVQVAR